MPPPPHPPHATPFSPPLPPDATQVPDGEFLCPKCKADEASAPSLSAANAKASLAHAGTGQKAATGSNRVRSSSGDWGEAAPREGNGVAGGAGGEGGGALEVAREGGAGAGTPGISVVATDGSVVELTQIAM